jgi:hypothetical protein
MFMSKSGNPQVETWIVYKDYCIRLKVKDIPLAKPQVPENGAEVSEYFNESHEGKVAIMPYNISSGSSHEITAPASENSIRIMLPERFHEIGSMQVARCLAGYDVVSHLSGDIRIKNRIIMIKVINNIPRPVSSSFHETRYNRRGMRFVKMLTRYMVFSRMTLSCDM